MLLSIGGWTYSQAGHFNFVTDAGMRNTFVQSAVQLVEDYGFDGMSVLISSCLPIPSFLTSVLSIVMLIMNILPLQRRVLGWQHY